MNIIGMNLQNANYSNAISAFTGGRRYANLAPLQYDSVSFSGSKAEKSNETKLRIAKVKADLKDAIKNNDAETIYNYLGMGAKKDADGNITLKNYYPADLEEEFTYEDLGINEQKLFENVVKIEGDADFADSEISCLKNLKSIGNDVIFYDSKVTDLGSLEEIGGDADFGKSNVTDLGSLKFIDGKADFRNSKVENLGNLKYIGGNAYFGNSKITDLSPLYCIGGEVTYNPSKMKNVGTYTALKDVIETNDAETIYNYFGIDAEEDEDGNITLKEYRQPGEDFTFDEIGIDEQKLFENVVKIEGNAFFKDSKITNLKNLKKIDGHAYFDYSKVADLGSLEEIGGGATFADSKITSLKNLKRIGSNADFMYSKVRDLGSLEEIGGDVNIAKSPFSDADIAKSPFLDVNITKSSLTKKDFENINIGGQVYDNWRDYFFAARDDKNN